MKPIAIAAADATSPLPKAIRPAATTVNPAASHGNGTGGASTTRASMEPATSRLPILAYHRVCRTTSRRTAGLHVDPTAFEEQLHYLRDAGFRSVSLEEWRQAAATRSPVPGRALAITFDGGYVDFAEHAWPLLQKYGFDASIFVATDLVGRTHFDGHGLDDEAARLNWTDLRGLQADGVSIGSHSASPRSLVGRPPVEVAREVAASRAKLAEELGAPVRTFAYPFGLASRALQHLVGACGYSFGLTRAGHPAGWQDSLLALPRQVVTGCTTLSSFMRRLPL